MSYIILRDIPKQSVQLDLLLHQIQGGFRGFRDIPGGFHYGAVLSQGKWREFWCYLQAETVLVKRFDAELQKLVEDPPEQIEQYSQLAGQNAMDQVLMPYPVNQWENWQSLTQYIKTDSPKLYLEQSSFGEVNSESRSRFEKAFIVAHQGNIEAFLAEFQFAFLRWWMTTKGEMDRGVQEYWSSLLDGMYNAGERAIASHPELFSQFIDVLLPQLAQLPPEAFTPKSVVCTHLDYLIEDINDTEIGELRQKGRILSAYIQKRQAS
ncbi:MULTISPECIES: hypothetical protein [Spirulina sp. CCY15215]|uniref:hypothetical protein n=1 Tax=Spirulina sp. CCY15215 TaxID=2767591 RepID=UPI00194EB609|nr:hypothetical protein [Spirulina major]